MKRLNPEKILPTPDLIQNNFSFQWRKSMNWNRHRCFIFFALHPFPINNFILRTDATDSNTHKKNINHCVTKTKLYKQMRFTWCHIQSFVALFTPLKQHHILCFTYIENWILLYPISHHRSNINTNRKVAFGENLR